MLDIKYLIDAKSPLAETHSWDIFISAYNDSSRVQEIFKKVIATEKHWIILPEYCYSPIEIPTAPFVWIATEKNEADQIINTIGQIIDLAKPDSRICIDMTGFMRPQILFILKYLKARSFNEFDMLYTEPSQYSRKEDTPFSLDDVNEVRQVSGYEGLHSHDMSQDLIIIGTGYDHELISRVILEKEGSRLVQLHSLPSLSADMYQESLIRLDRASVPSHPSDDQVFFSSANDPYLTATALSRAYNRLKSMRQITNLYLSPLATKPQALGFGLFYIAELENTPASVIFPYSSKYSRQTSKGVGRTWVYPIFFEQPPLNTNPTS